MSVYCSPQTCSSKEDMAASSQNVMSTQRLAKDSSGRSSRSTSPDSAGESGSLDNSSVRSSVSCPENTSALRDDGHVALAYVIHNTFIEPIEDRPGSLEGFLQDRLVCSCPPTRAPSHEAHNTVLPEVLDVLVGDLDTSYVVRNTFIEASVGRPPSLEGFYEERQAASCPPTRLTSVDEDYALSQLLDGLNDNLVNGNAAPYLDRHMHAPLSRQDAEEPDKLLLLIHDALGMAELGSDELPSIGSRQHSSGNCKPCAFFHARTCKSGENCAFCHSCEPGEKKRRQRIKDEQVRVSKQRQQQQQQQHQQLLQWNQPQALVAPDAVFDSILQTLQQARW